MAAKPVNEVNLSGWIRSMGLLVRKQDGVILGFGQKNMSFDQLKAKFPKMKWAQLEQIHSANVIDASSETVNEADGHISRLEGLGLVVKSADCIPILITCPGGHVAAIHAGWRGIANDIVINALTRLKEAGAAAGRATVWIGPHIRFASFEVDLDVAEQLMMTAARAGASPDQIGELVARHPIKSEKRRVNLEKIVRLQLASCGVPAHGTYTLAIDTFSTPEWASFRRDGADSGRNLSFIARL